MAFKIGNRIVLNDADPSADLLTNSNLDKLQINTTDVLVHDGSTITLRNVSIDNGVNLGSATINSDNITEGSTNLFFTDARAQSALATTVTNLTAGINTNTADITTNASAISTNTANIATNTANIATNATAITTGDASTLTSANLYTDTRETAITTAYTAAIASSTSSGSSNANAYTDAEIATATADITTAYQTYADTAETDAIATANAYADTAIANLVDTAPTTLDTLNELAAALGDDANFSTTVANSVATKLATADFTSTADTWVSTKSTTDISEGTNLYYTDARVDARITNAGQTPVTGSDLDMNGNKVLFANVYANIVDLPNASTYHGMFAHVHATGKGYFSHAGNWVELANASQVFDRNYNSLSNLPTIPTNNNQLTNGAGYVTTDTTYTAGNGLSLSGANEFTMSGSYTGSFTASGDVTAYSDKRLKRNIETITNAVDTVSKLRGVNYEKDGRDSIGVIAQEIEEVLPQVVHTDTDGMKSVAYGNIVGILIEAIKEQQKEIEELKKKL